MRQTAYAGAGRRRFAIVATAALAAALLIPASTAFAAGGSIVGWGDDQNGVLDMPAGLTDVVQISTDQSFALALHADGTVTGWGVNAFSDEDLRQQRMSRVKVPTGLSDVVQVVAAGGQAVYLRANGEVIAVGRTDFGQSRVPSGLRDVVQVASTGQHTLALLADGTVTGWGWNAWQQLDFPPGLSDVVQVAAGVHHGIALHRDGTLTLWGNEEHGQATPPADLGTVVSVAAGYWNSTAILADGTVVEWGAVNPRLPEQQGVAIPPTMSVGAGLHSSVAVHADGTITVWGSNENGQLDVPAGLSGVTAVAVGRYHTLALSDPDAARLAITGEVAPGSTVSAELTNWRGSAGDVSYQWYVGGVEVEGAAGASYTLGDQDAQSRIMVRALSTVPGSTLIISDAVEVAPVAEEPSAGPTEPGDGADEGGAVPWAIILVLLALVIAGIIVFVVLRARRRSAESGEAVE